MEPFGKILFTVASDCPVTILIGISAEQSKELGFNGSGITILVNIVVGPLEYATLIGELIFTRIQLIIEADVGVVNSDEDGQTGLHLHGTREEVVQTTPVVLTSEFKLGGTIILPDGISILIILNLINRVLKVSELTITLIGVPVG